MKGVSSQNKRTTLSIKPSHGARKKKPLTLANLVVFIASFVHIIIRCKTSGSINQIQLAKEGEKRQRTNRRWWLALSELSDGGGAVVDWFCGGGLVEEAEE